MTTEQATPPRPNYTGGVMAIRLRRVFWLVGLLAMIAHMIILIAGAAGMAGSSSPIDFKQLNQPFWTSVALRVIDVGWPFLLFNAGLDLPIILAHCLPARNRLAARLFVASVVMRMLIMVVCIAAAAHLAHVGMVQIQTSRVGATWRVFRPEDVLGEFAGHLLLALPLVVYSMRWLPLIWIPRIRRNTRLCQGRCVSCGYDLRALTADRCPECGTTRVRAPEHSPEIRPIH